MSLIIGILLICSFVRADIVLPTIEVIAEKDISAFTFSSSTKIPAHKLEMQTTPLITPLIEEVPGVVANQNGGPGGRVSYFIRGTESRHVAFTLDGLKLNDPSNTDRQFDSAFFTAPFLKGIEVHKGPQAVLFGSDSFGGLIEMKTRKGEFAPEGRLTINGGSFGTVDSSFSQDWKSKKTNGSATLTRFHSDGISRLNKKRYHGKEADATDITQFTTSTEHKIASKVRVDLLACYLHGRNELDGSTEDNSHDISRNDQYLLQQKTHFEFNKTTAVSFRNGMNRHQRFINTLAIGKETYAGDLIQDELILRNEFEGVNLLVGIANENENFKLSNIEQRFDLTSAFLQSSFKGSGFKFQAGGRFDEHSRYGSFQTGSFGVSVADFSAQYSQGFKAPSLYQLYAPPLYGSPLGNRDLVPESNHSLEGKWTLKKEKFETEVAIFQNRLSNLITYTNQGYLNQGRFITEGVELSGKVKQKSFGVSGSFTHQNFRKEDTVVLRRPYNILHSTVTVFPIEDAELFLKMRWSDSRKDLNQNGKAVKLNAFETFDLGFRIVKLTCDYGVQFVNILNREYEELYGYSVMPRSLFAHVGFRF